MNNLNTSSVLPPSYQHLKIVGRSAIGQTWLVKDTRCEEAPFRIIQQLDVYTDDPSLVEFSQNLLMHKVQTLQALFRDLASTGTIHDYFSVGKSFFVVQPMVKGQSLHRLHWVDGDRLTMVSVLSDLLMVLQQVYNWGMSCCCLYPSDLIYRQPERDWVWTGTGILKTIVYQIGQKHLPLTSLFPKEMAAYFAPEFLQGHFHVGSDLYMVGVSLIQALTQLPLKDLVHGNDGYFTIRRSWYRHGQFPDALVDILNRMAHPNPAKRYATTAEVLSALNRLQ